MIVYLHAKVDVIIYSTGFSLSFLRFSFFALFIALTASKIQNGNMDWPTQVHLENGPL